MAPYTAAPTATPTLGPRPYWDPMPRLADKKLPPPKSPEEEKAATSMFLGICLSVTFVLAVPMIWVWLVDRIRRRKLDPFRKLRDLERKGKRPGIDPPAYEKAPPKDSIWARQEKYGTKKPPRAITADQILGVDKRSYLQRIVPQSGASASYPVSARLLTGSNRRIFTATHCSACTPWVGQAECHVVRG
jgi:hypothetical protein